MSTISTRRRGTRSLVWGLVLLALVAPVLLGLGIWVGVSRGGDLRGVNEYVHPDDPLALRAGREITVEVREENMEEGARRPTSNPECEATGPDGRVPFDGLDPVRVVDDPKKLDRADETFTMGTFRTAREGTYRVDCPGFSLARLTDERALARRTAWIAGGVGGGIVLGGLTGLAGLILTVIGMLRLNARSRPAGAPGRTHRVR